MKFVDLFAGCGGMSLGLEMAGFHPVLVSEINENARASYRVNRPSMPDEVFCNDVAKIDEAILGRLGEVDLVCGGPPCQGYSAIGYRRSYVVDRESIPSNHLFREMTRIIDILRPKAFLFENVRGILNGRWTPDGRKGEIWHDVHSAFVAIKGYRIHWDLVHAKDFGVPQSRPRVIMIGVREDVANQVRDRLTISKHRAPDPEDVLGDLMDMEWDKVSETTSYPQLAYTDFQERCRRLPDGRCNQKGDPVWEHVYAKHSPRIIEKFQYMLDHNGLIPDHMATKKFSTRLIPRRWGNEGPSLTLTSLPDDFVHPFQPRTLTVREYARFQTFPDWYRFKGCRTVGNTDRAGNPLEGIWERVLPQFTQVANAVPVEMARIIGQHLAACL